MPCNEKALSMDRASCIGAQASVIGLQPAARQDLALQPIQA